MRRLTLALLLFAALYAQSESPIAREGSYWVQTVTGSQPAAGACLRVVSRGRVTVQGVDSGRVAYTLKKRVAAASQAEAARLLREFGFEVTSRANGLLVVVTPPKRPTASAELNLRAPRGLQDSTFETRAGNVEVYDMDGAVAAETTGGRIEVDRMGGSVTAKTGGGDVRLGRVKGIAKCLSGGGAIRADWIGGESWLETAGGEIWLGEARGPVHASTAGGNIRVGKAVSGVSAQTDGGMIEVLDAGGPVTAETSGGSIAVASARGVRCETAAGAIRLRAVQGSLRASTAMGSVFADVMSGARLEDSFLSTGAGDITMFLPSNLAVTIRAQNESAGIGRIVSEFPEIRLVQAELSSVRPALAEGSLNGGGPLVRLATSGGTIYLRRQK